MSAGPGHVMRTIATAVEAMPNREFYADDLYLLAFPGVRQIEKRHRVAVLRAMRKLAAARPHLGLGYLHLGPGWPIPYLKVTRV